MLTKYWILFCYNDNILKKHLFPYPWLSMNLLLDTFGKFPVLCMSWYFGSKPSDSLDGQNI